MRLLYFTRDYTSHDHRFLSGLAQNGCQVGYLRLERNSFVYEERALPPTVEIIAWKGGKGPAHLKDGPTLLLDLKRVIREWKPDMVLAGPLQRCALLTALTGFQPLVSMSWGYDLLQDARRSASWEWATRFTLKRSAALVGDCETIRQLAVSYGMPDERIVTFPWGIDLGHFHPASPPDRLPGQGESFRVLSTRGWEPIYGVDIIARAFAKVGEQRPELQLIMLGNGSMAGDLHKILARFGPNQIGQDAGMPPRVLYRGQVRYAELPRTYRSADLYISASHSDGTSISLLEAMACGLPVLVSDIPGNREWVKPGLNGWLFPDGDTDALAQAILNALDHRDRLAETGKNARKTAEQRADWSQNFPLLYHAFEIATSKSG